MAGMLGRRRVPGCCPWTRNNLPGADCDGGHPIGTRAAKRREDWLGDEFAAWSDVSLEIARETFGAAAEPWPTDRCRVP